MHERDLSARDTSLMDSWCSTRLWVRRTSLDLGDSAAHGRFGQQDLLGFFPSHLPPWKKTEEMRIKGWWRNKGGEAARPESIHLFPPECFLSLPPPTPILPQKTQELMTHTCCSSSSSQRHYSLDVLLSLVPALPLELRRTPAMDVQGWAGTTSRAPQSPQASAPFQLGALPSPAAKTLLGPPPISLGVVVYFS